MPTLYLNGHDTDARIANGLIEVSRVDPKKDDVSTMTVRLFDLDRVIVAGRPTMTLPVLHQCAYHGIPIYFITGHGRWLGGFYPTTNGHALRRIRQYELARDGDFILRLAKAFVRAKIQNSRRVLQRLAANRSMARDPEQMDVCNSLLAVMNQAGQAKDLDTLRGHEGYAAALYFRRLAIFFPQSMPFVGRSRRPPRDGANALLSWAYTIVLAEIDGAVRSAGLDPCIGCLHELSYGRPSLSLDILEPLRAPLCDMLVLHILNHGILKEDAFEYNSEDGGTYLAKDGRKRFFAEYERTMTRKFAPAKNEPHTDFRRVLVEQTNVVLRAMERRQEPEFFNMP